MTVSSSNVLGGPTTGAGSTVTVNFTFPVWDYNAVEAEDQIEVILVTIATGAESILTRGTAAGQYSVTMNGDQDASPGGSITTTSTYSSAYKVYVRSSPTYTQNTDLTPTPLYNGQTHERQFDQFQRQINTLKDQVRRAAYVSTPAGSSFDGKITGPFTAGAAILVNSGSTGYILGSPASVAVSAGMTAVVQAASTSAAGDIFYVTATGAVSARSLSARAADIVNILDYGGVGDDSTNNDAALAAAHTAVSSSGGTIYFPPGRYRFNTQWEITKPVTLLGAGPTASVLRPNFAGDHAIEFLSPSACAVQSLGISSVVSRTTGTALLRIYSCVRPSVVQCHFDTPAGGLIMFESCNFVQMINVYGDSGSGSVAGDTCVHNIASGAFFSNCGFRQMAPTGTYGNGPTWLIRGTATSLRASNCQFAGAGPRTRVAVSSITSNGSAFTVNTSSAHGQEVGNIVVLRGMSPSGYNSVWRVATVTDSDTFTVANTANYGTSTVNGNMESMTACVMVSNEDGAVNESQLDNCIFEATQTNLYGTVAFYMDGRRGTAGAKSPLQGWQLTGCYYDFGMTGILLSGTAGTVANDPTVFGVNITGGHFENQTRQIHLDQVASVNISGIQPCANQDPVADAFFPTYTNAIYIVAGSAAPYTQGITITGCNIGMPRAWLAALTGRDFDHGITLDGANMENIVITGNNIHGGRFGINYENTALATARRFKIRDNIISDSAWPIDNQYVIPSAASATTLNIAPFHDTVKVTGTTNIQNIQPVWHGKEVTLIFTGALTLTTGGNLGIAANRAVVAGELIKTVFDGTSWYIGGGLA